LFSIAYDKSEVVATINLANNSQKLLTQPWPCTACHAPRKSFLLFFFKCWQLCCYYLLLL